MYACMYAHECALNEYFVRVCVCASVNLRFSYLSLKFELNCIKFQVSACPTVAHKLFTKSTA